MATARIPRVLLVDDSVDLINYLSFQLQRAGFEVCTAFGGLEAVRLLEEDGAFAAVVVDLQMPHGDGLGVLEAIRSSGGELPVFLMSGDSKLNDAHAKKLGATGFLAKPFAPSALTFRIMSALAKSG